MDFFDLTTTIKTDSTDSQSSTLNPNGGSALLRGTNFNEILSPKVENSNGQVKVVVIPKQPMSGKVIYLGNNNRVHPQIITNQNNLKVSLSSPNIRNLIRVPTTIQSPFPNRTVNLNQLRHVSQNGALINAFKIEKNDVVTPVISQQYTLKRVASNTTMSPVPMKIQRQDISQTPYVANVNSQYPLHYFPGNVPEEYKFENKEFGELTVNEAYSDYQPAKLKIGKPHPYKVVESRSLSTVEAPIIRYQLKMSPIIIDKGILSNVQLEAVVYACQRHEEYLTDGRRAGFLIGDGAGVGKGRTVAGIIFENFYAGRKKAIWVSVSNDLKEDAKRDLKDIGKEIKVNIKVKPLNKMSYFNIDSNENGKFKDGVLFVTYSSLISTCKKTGKKLNKTRLDQIVKWFGKEYDGVIVLDECHKAKNLHMGGKTKTGTIVKKLQDLLKHARIVYASATGASEPKHMAYMVRLGLWGPEKPFKKFDEFESTLTKHGVGAMELIAIEMKMKGLYLARQLSFDDVEFDIEETKIESCTINGHKFKDVYNKCVVLWGNIYKEFKKTFERNKLHDKDENLFQAQFWSSHQRFFKYLCISAKIQDVVRIGMREIENGKCIVIGLQSTGEANTMDALEESSGELYDFVSSAKGVIKNLIENHYPSAKNLQKLREKKESKFMMKSSDLKKLCSDLKPVDKTVKDPKNTWQSESEDDSEDSCSETDSDSDIENEKSSNKKRFFKSTIVDDEKLVDDHDIFSEDYINQHKLLKCVEEMNDMFPVNVLDQLIKEFCGPDLVAELTGRKGRMIETDNSVSYQSRREGEIGLDQINLLEKDRFNNGDKLVAIISDAASTGISLHSDQRFKNQKQRVHITLELPWSADKAIQQFGRTHRSNQVVPPHYLFLISDLAGERRFAATVAKRLESLGALTHGDRRCADTRDLSQFNLDNDFGAKAVKIMFNAIFNLSTPTVPFPAKYLSRFRNSNAEFKKAAIEALLGVGLDRFKPVTVTKFLNRILGLELDMQNALFQYFIDIIDSESQRAKKSNEFDHGIRDIMNDIDNVFVEDIRTIKINSKSKNDNIILYKVKNINSGVPWKECLDRYLKAPSQNMFCVSNDNKFQICALAEQQQADQYKLITPNFPDKTIDFKSLSAMYHRISIEEAQMRWEKVYRESENRCHHSIIEQRCPNVNSAFCANGKRTKINYIITGAVFYAWKIISRAYNNKIKMEIVRVQLHDTSKLIGALVPPEWYETFVDLLKKTCENSD